MDLKIVSNLLQTMLQGISFYLVVSHGTDMYRINSREEIVGSKSVCF